ncbi:hypothetical protein DYB25_006138 [Aphanomyces astaci]|uniref:Uncharacterized protein n=1 Tax=Aphanomyces astaci TaxID=112090 RepID=A0A396ZW69_APHAT|nr:hypothetical protein DYB25_006138 [Aphanomyces astaci]
MLTDITATIAAGKALYGYDAPEPGYTTYDCATIPRYLKMGIRNRTRQLHEIETAVAARQRILYLEPDDSDPTEYHVVFGNCSSLGGYRTSDRLYADWHLLPLLQRILHGINHSTSIDLLQDDDDHHVPIITHVAVVDCAYGGRQFQDTSMLKAYLVDVNLTTMTSFALQTMNAVRESTRMEVQVGPVVVSSAQLSRFGLGAPDGTIVVGARVLDMFGLTYDGVSEYRTLVSFDFPYEPNTPFHDAISVADDESSRLNQWRWRVKSTNELIVLNGYSGTSSPPNEAMAGKKYAIPMYRGIHLNSTVQLYVGYYRGSKSSQTSFVRYVVAMDATPVRDFAIDNFQAQGHSKDSRTWMHVLGIVTVGLRIGFPVGVSHHMAAMSLWGPQFWLPDVCGIVKRQLRLRALLIFVTVFADRFWIVQEWALTAGYRRYDLEPMIGSDDVVLSDSLVTFLVLTDVIATAMHVAVVPIVPVLLFILCYTQREMLVQALTSDMEPDVASYMNDVYMRNLLTYSPTTMDIWTRYPLEAMDDPAMWFVMREYVWFFAACVVMAVGLALIKLVHVLVRSLSTTVTPSGRMPSTRDLEPCKIIDNKSNTLQFLAPFIPPRALGQWGVVSVPPTSADDDTMLGVAQYHNSEFQLDRSSIWTAGWVLVGRRHLVRIDDLPNLFVNSVMATSSIVKVYGCAVDEDNTKPNAHALPRSPRLFLNPRLVPLPPTTISLRHLRHLSVDVLWVREISVGDATPATVKHMKGKRKGVDVYEWAIAAAFRRYHLTPLVARTEIIRCHLLALFLVWTDARRHVDVPGLGQIRPSRGGLWRIKTPACSPLQSVRQDDDDDESLTVVTPPPHPLDVPCHHMAGISTVSTDFLDNFCPQESSSVWSSRGLATIRPSLFRFTQEAFQVDKTNVWLAGWVILDRK